MKNNYFKVNRRYVFLYLLILFVVFGIVTYSPRIRAEGLSDIFGAIIPPGAAPGDYSTGWGTTPTPPTYPYPPFPTTTPVSVLTGTPAPIPAGDCTNGLNRALQNLDAVSSQVLPVYQQASAQTGIPWEIFAAIHYIETGGSFNPNGSLISGRPIGAVEPDQGNKIYHSLLESAIDAGSVFKSKYGSQVGPFNNFQQLVSAFAGYNGTGNRQCNGFVAKPQSQYTGCPAYYPNEDHLYPLACYDERHKDMWYIYCSDGQVCPPIGGSNPGIKYSPNKVGALTLIAGIQARSLPTPTVPPGTPTPPGLPGNPAYGNDIIQEVRSIYGAPIECTYSPYPRLCIEINTSNVNRIMGYVSKAGQSFKTQVIRNTNNQGTLQCVGAAFGLSAEINGVIPQVGHGAACQFTDTTAVHQFHRYGDPGVTPQPGDLVVWNPSVGSCTNTNAGHIAYIMEVLDAQNVVVGEGSWGRSGNISVRTVRLNSHAPIGFLRKI